MHFSHTRPFSRIKHYCYNIKKFVTNFDDISGLGQTFTNLRLLALLVGPKLLAISALSLA